MPFIISFIFLIVFIIIYGVSDFAQIIMLVNGFIALHQMISSALKQKVSLAFTHWFFLFIFFFLIPYIQFANDSFRYVKVLYFRNEILYTELVTLIWIIFFILFYNLNFKSVLLKINYTNVKKNLKKKANLIYLLLIINLLVIAYYIAIFGLETFFIRGKSDEMMWASLGSKSVVLLFMRGFRPYTLHLFLIAFIIFSYKKHFFMNRNILVLLGLIGLLFNFPTGNSRFYAFVVIMILYAILFMKSGRSGVLFIPLMFLGILGSLWINQFREINTLNEVTMNVEYDRIFSGDFDAYEMFVIGYRYIDMHGLSYGNNLLGAILFFVPRAIWPTKPVGTGYYLASTVTNIPGLEFFNKNLSFPFIGEMYFAFGIIGIILGAILFGSVFGSLDRYYFINFFRKDKEFKLFLLFYSGFFAFILFIMRGDLINSVAYFAGFTFAYWFTLRILGIKIRISRIKLNNT